MPTGPPVPSYLTSFFFPLPQGKRKAGPLERGGTLSGVQAGGKDPGIAVRGTCTTLPSGSVWTDSRWVKGSWDLAQFKQADGEVREGRSSIKERGLLIWTAQFPPRDLLAPAPPPLSEFPPPDIPRAQIEDGCRTRGRAVVKTP